TGRRPVLRRRVVRQGILTLAALAFGIAPVPPVHAQGWIEPAADRALLTPGGGIVRLRSAVNVRVVDRIAHFEIEEWFRNDGPALGESDYHYPLPGGAVFRDFALQQGDDMLRGEAMDADR